MSVQDNILGNNELVAYAQDMDAKKAAMDKWNEARGKGCRERVHRLLDLPYMTMYICVNNVGALVLHRETCYSFMNVRSGCTIARNTPFISINGSDVSFPFSAKVIECWEPACKEYIGIFQVLK